MDKYIRPTWNEKNYIETIISNEKMKESSCKYDGN